MAFIDDYCARYRDLFHNVRHFEQFTALHLGLLAETRRKSLPRLGKTVHADPQALHHFLAHAEWSVQALRQRRLGLLRQALGATPFILCLDETGDRKKGHTTDYVASQYSGNLHTLANGSVSVNAYGVLGSTTFPLLFRVFKPETRLKAGDGYKTKPQLAIELIRAHLSSARSCCAWVSTSVSSWPIVSTARAARSSARCTVYACSMSWPSAPITAPGCCRMLPGQRIRRTPWRPFDRVFTDGASQQRFIRETIFGTRRTVRYYQITTDP